MFATDETVGLAEWIIDDTCLVVFFGGWKCLKNAHLYPVLKKHSSRSFSFFLLAHEHLKPPKAFIMSLQTNLLFLALCFSFGKIAATRLKIEQ